MKTVIKIQIVKTALVGETGKNDGSDRCELRVPEGDGGSRLAESGKLT